MMSRFVTGRYAALALSGLLAGPAAAAAGVEDDRPAPAEFAAAPSADVGRHRIRELRGRKFNGRGVPIVEPGPAGGREAGAAGGGAPGAPQGDGDHPLSRRSADPPAPSGPDASAVLVGHVLSGASFLSPDRAACYTEFGVEADEVAKAPRRRRIRTGQLLVLQRLGGEVLFPSGRRLDCDAAGRGGRPRIGERYLFVLAWDADSDTFTILREYPLRAGSVGPASR